MLGANPEEMEGEAADDDGSDSEDEAAVAEGDDRPGGPQPRRDRGGPDAEGAYRAYTRALSSTSNFSISSSQAAICSW